MNNLDFLIGEQDIKAINLKKENLVYSLVFTFEWNMDYGCFNYTKTSNLTVYIPLDKFEQITNDLKNKTRKSF